MYVNKLCLLVGFLAFPLQAHENERYGVEIELKESENPINRLNPIVITLPDSNRDPEKPYEVVPTAIKAEDICFTNIGKTIPYGLETEALSPQLALSCKKRDSIVKAFGLASIFLKGSSYVCKLTPLPQAQIAATAFDIASFASTSITAVIAVTDCEDTSMNRKFDSIIKACERLRQHGVDCQGVDDTPF